MILLNYIAEEVVQFALPSSTRLYKSIFDQELMQNKVHQLLGK